MKDFHGPSHIYIPGQSLSMYPGNIVAYENPESAAGGTNVLFLDSHVEFMKAEAFREELRTTYERRGKPTPETSSRTKSSPVRRSPPGLADRHRSICRCTLAKANGVTFERACVKC